jgi:hypothetical protein
MFTAIEISKMAVRQVVALNVAKVSTNVICNNTDADPDSITVKVGTMIVGEVVASKAGPHTDAMVERTFAWIKNRKNKTVTE